jgi:DNA-binding NarL/FixJ family response regulator
LAQDQAAADPERVRPAAAAGLSQGNEQTEREHPFRVALVDDQPDVLAWARAALEQSPAFRVVAEWCGGEQALTQLGQLGENWPDVWLIDFDMPGMNGLQVTRRVRQRAPDVRVVLMSLSDDRELPALARAAGAVGFLPKQRLSPDAVLLLLDEGRHGTS